MPQIHGTRHFVALRFFTGDEIKLHNGFAICSIGKFESEHLGVCLGLLDAVGWQFIVCLRLNDSNWKLRLPIVENIIGASRFSARARRLYFPSSERDFAFKGRLVRGVRIAPTGGFESRIDISDASLRFVHNQKPLIFRARLFQPDNSTGSVPTNPLVI